MCHAITSLAFQILHFPDFPDGEQLSASGICQPCQVGTYRSRGENKKCVACPPGTTTEATLSTRREQCNTPKCKPGQFLVKET
ncbi:unnamed protein product [Caenorhabditis brenneri]